MSLEVRQLIREMSLANPFWGAPRIHGELLKLGIDMGQTSVAKYMARRKRPPSQGWRTFLLNHADGIASIDLFVAPTISSGCSRACWFSDMIDGASCGSASLRTRLPNGSPGKSARHVVGRARHKISSATGTASTARHLRTAFERWAFATDRQRRDLLGRTAMSNV